MAHFTLESVAHFAPESLAHFDRNTQVAEYERSGLTRRGFSEQAGIAVSTLDYWRRQVRDRERMPIMPVKIEPDRE